MVFDPQFKKPRSCVFSWPSIHLCATLGKQMHFGFSFWWRTAGAAYPAATQQGKTKSKCDVAQTDSPTQHTRGMISTQRKVCFTEECLIVRYIVPELAPMRYLWILALFTLLFSLLIPLLPFSSPFSSSRPPRPPRVCMYVCLCLCIFRALESRLSKKNVLGLERW